MNDNLATELLKQIKADKKRWFIIALVELAIILIITGIFVWYISLPIDMGDIQQAVDGGDYNQLVGGDLYGSTESDIQTQSVAQPTD